MKCFFTIVLFLLHYTYCIQMEGGESNKNYRTYQNSPKKSIQKKCNAFKLTTQAMNITARQAESNGKNVEASTVSISTKPSNNKNIMETGDISATISKRTLVNKQFSRSIEQSNNHYYIPIVVVADTSFIKFHKNIDYENYIKNAIHMVSEYFHDSSLGVNVTVSIVRNILYLDKEGDIFQTNTAFDVLNNFCNWTNNNKDKFTEFNNDIHHVAILVTRKQLVGKESRLVQGATYTASACIPQKACILVRDRGLLLGVNIAHILGHLLGALDEEDDVTTSNMIYSSIMRSPVKHDRISWSNSSSMAIRTFFSDGLGDCLKREPSSLKRFPSMLIGAAYNADIQCQLLYKGPESCYLNTEDYCKELFCKHQNGSCISSGTQPAQGTLCGIDKWCFNTECVHLGYRPGAVNGGWDEWQEWGPCSRTCGGGVKMSQRVCTLPAPANGGRYCVGSSYRAKTCNTQTCPLYNNTSYRAEQCAKLFGKDVTLQNHDKSDGCILHCVKQDKCRLIRMQAQAADGTPCRPGTNDVCVKGSCMRVGCDWVLGSSVIEDRCGICGGDGSECELVHINHKIISGPPPPNGHSIVFVGTIPRWSTRVKIYEAEPSANYLALAPTHYNPYDKQYLVGGMNQTAYGEFNVGDQTGYYTHLLDDQDYIMIKGPLPYNVDVYQVAPFNDPVPVHYSYMALNKSPHVPLYNHTNIKLKSSNYYEWEYVEYSTCSVRCEGGVERFRARCVSPSSGVVSDKYCEETHKPRDPIRLCNLDACAYRWEVGPWRINTHGSSIRSVVCLREMKQWQSSPEIVEDLLCAAPKPTEIEDRSFNKKTQTKQTNETKHDEFSEVNKTSKNHCHKENKPTSNTPTKPNHDKSAEVRNTSKIHNYNEINTTTNIPSKPIGSRTTHGPSYSTQEVEYKYITIVTEYNTLLKPTYEAVTKLSTPKKSINPSRSIKQDEACSLLKKQNMLLNYEKYYTTLGIYDDGQKKQTNSEISTYIPFVNYNNHNNLSSNNQEYNNNTTEMTNFYDVLETLYGNKTIKDKNMIKKPFSKNINNIDFSQILNITYNDKIKENKTIRESTKEHLNINDLNIDDLPNTSKNIITTVKSTMKEATSDINLTHQLKTVNDTTKVYKYNIETFEKTLNKSKDFIYETLIDYILNNNINFSAIQNTYSNDNRIFSNKNGLIDTTTTTSQFSPTKNAGAISQKSNKLKEIFLKFTNHFKSKNILDYPLGNHLDKNISQRNKQKYLRRGTRKPQNKFAHDHKNIEDHVREKKGHTIPTLKFSNITQDEAGITTANYVKNFTPTKSGIESTFQMAAQNYIDNKGKIKYNKKDIDKNLLDIINKFDVLKLDIQKQKKHMSTKTLKRRKRKLRSSKIKRDVDNFMKHLRKNQSERDVIGVVEKVNILKNIKDRNEQPLSYEFYLLQKDNIYILLVKPVQSNVIESDQLYILVKTILSHNDYRKLLGLPETKIIFDKKIYEVINKSLNRFDAEKMLTNILRDIVRAKLNINKNNKVSQKENTTNELPFDSEKIKSFKNFKHLITHIKDRKTHKWNKVKKMLKLGSSKKREGFMYTYFDFYKLKYLQNVFYLEQKGNKKKFNAYIILQLSNDNNNKPLIEETERIVYNKNVFEIKNVKQIMNIDNVMNTLIKLSMIDKESEINRQSKHVRERRQKININYSPKIQNSDVINNLNLFVRKGYRNISQVNLENKHRTKRHHKCQNVGFRHRARKYISLKYTTPDITTPFNTSSTSREPDVNINIYIGSKLGKNVLDVTDPNVLALNYTLDNQIHNTTNLPNDRHHYIEDYIPVEDENIVAADVSPNDVINDLSDNAYRVVGGDLPMTYKIITPK